MKSVSKMGAKRAAILLASACGWILAAGAPANAATVVTFKVTGATQTMGAAVDAAGDVAGTWYDSGFVTHGFLRTAAGTLTTFDPSGSTGTNVYGMNDTQWVAGAFSDGAGTHGFLRAPDGTVTVYDAPGSAGYTQILAVNDDNAFAGTYAADDGNDYGFVVDKKGKFTSFAPSGARYTSATAINSKGATAGQGTDSDSTIHGFVRSVNGTLTSFDVPGGDEPFVRGINVHGTVAGTSYEDYVSDTGQGYLLLSDGTFQTFQVVSGFETDANGLNDQGLVCGDYYDAGGAYHGFIRNKKGKIKSFDVGNTGATACTAINASGQTTGYYYSLKDIGVAFLRTP